MTGIKLAADLTLPLDVATRRLAILAMSGAGKSNVAVYLAESMFAEGIPWVAIDPKGDWWGVRSNASGKGAGLPIPIFGGLHGDIPLEPTAGKVIGELIVDQRLTCVLDVSEFESRQLLYGFLHDLGETLLRRNRDPLHLFLEEADEYLPQKTGEKGNLLKCLGTWQRVVKRGRFRGLGTTQITQRNAALNKDTLYQAEALIALRATGKGDREAVKGWVEHNGAAAEIVASLPTLQDGEGWISSPAWLRRTVRAQFYRRTTFDSGQTPAHVQSSRPPATLADVDLAKISERMTATIERAKADDPKELRKEIALLKKQLAFEQRTIELLKDQKPEPERVDVVPRALYDALFAQHDALIGVFLPLQNVLRCAAGDVGKLAFGMQELKEQLDARAEQLGQTALDKVARNTPRIHAQPAAMKAEKPAPEAKHFPTARIIDENPKLPRMARAFLTALAQWGPMSKGRLLVLTTYRSSGPVSNTFATLTRDGLIGPCEKGIGITEGGINALGSWEPLPRGHELREKIMRDASTMEAKFLAVIFDTYPEAIQKKDLLETTGYASSGPVSNAFARLVASGFVTNEARGQLRAADALME